MLPELRKWELHPNGEIGFDVFADSLQSLGYRTAGRWQVRVRVRVRIRVKG